MKYITDLSRTGLFDCKKTSAEAEELACHAGSDYFFLFLNR